MRSVFFYKPLQLSAHDATGWRWWFNVWTPAVLAVGVICVESTATFSAQNTSTWLRPIVQHLFGLMSDSLWEPLHHYMRKTGHFVGYGTVAFTFLRAWLHMLGRNEPATLLSWRVEASVLAIFSTAIVASCDEFHQTFLPGRTGTPMDVLLDTSGACTLCLLVWIICWSRERRRQFEVDWE
jgi:VanZ family protein